MPALSRPQKITFGEMRSTGVRGILIYCSDYKCSHSIAISADRFDDPIPVPKGKPLLTLKDAAAYILKLPKAKQKSPEWQTAGEALLMAAEDRGPMMHARIGFMQALNRHHVREFNPKHKEAHWGERKLKRDQ